VFIAYDPACDMAKIYVSALLHHLPVEFTDWTWLVATLDFPSRKGSSLWLTRTAMGHTTGS
jgi:hypothetical protein